MSATARVAITVTLLLLGAGTAHAQSTAVVQGRVLDPDGAPIAGAEVELAGRASIPTPIDGSFRFAGVAAGPTELRVRALGYVERRVPLQVGRDTTLYVRLERNPIPIDTVEARLTRVTVRGRITDERHRLGVAADIYIRPGAGRTDTDRTGRYRLGDVPVTDSSWVLVEAFGYLPQQARLATARDTALDFVMREDPVARAMMQVHLDRLAARSDSLDVAVETVYTDSVRQAGTLADVLRYSFDLRDATCVVLDERVQRAFGPGRHGWRSLTPDQVHSIEIIDRDIGPRRRVAGMLRIYTKDYIKGLVTGERRTGTLQYHRMIDPELCM
ncbi:MAG TPA: carboxypeptidase-like regulatory domain-containing protein [Longimicrobiales bacterium]|nr:carboxypeptidase-like regulatory domain-containing protein [Longimicrobiales bacterium]